jgi:hypothetical protein
MGTDDVIRVAGYRPVQTQLPEELMDAVSDELTAQLTTGYGLTYGDIGRAVTAAIDWLREHPAELARFVGARQAKCPEHTALMESGVDDQFEPHVWVMGRQSAYCQWRYS